MYEILRIAPFNAYIHGEFSKSERGDGAEIKASIPFGSEQKENRAVLTGETGVFRRRPTKNKIVRIDIDAAAPRRAAVVVFFFVREA